MSADENSKAFMPRIMSTQEIPPSTEMSARKIQPKQYHGDMHIRIDALREGEWQRGGKETEYECVQSRKW